MLALVTLLFAACGGSSAADPTATPPPAPTSVPSATSAPSATASPTSAPAPSATPLPSATATTAAAELPDTPLGERLAWVLDPLLTMPDAVTDAEITETFTADFIAVVPPAQLRSIATQFRAAYGLPSFVEFRAGPTDVDAVAAITTGAGADFLITIVIEAAEPYRISGLLLSPDEGDLPTPVPLADWSALDARLAGLAESSSFLAAELVDGACVPVYAVNADTALALGSTFKLYILGELANQVRHGLLTWDDELAVQEDLKSLPSGMMQDEPAGTTHSLRYFAEQMISISDNTATDHLLFHLGREQVEAFQAEMGHSNPNLNIPFLSTQEMFTIKLTLTGENVQRYIDADTAERRRMLEEEIDPLEPSLSQAGSWTAPRYIEDVEWFASATDLCHAMQTLQTLSTEPGLEPVADILSINPGVPFDPQMWTYIGYKGGSEPGVLNLTWLLQRADGRWFVLTLGLNDTERNIDENAGVQLAQSAAELLAQTP